jgi:phosphoribosylglycinamide formyltransferase-1
MIKVMEAKRLGLAVFVSGRGSNFLSILRSAAHGKLNACVRAVVSDRADAPALQKASDAGIPAYAVLPGAFASVEDYETHIIGLLEPYAIDLIVLAGYMRLVRAPLLTHYKNRVVNIHPSLLPAFSGLRAQKQALDYGVRFSGCTVHLVDEGMDAGPIIAQSVVPVLPADTEASLSERILEEEHKLYPRSLQLIAEGRVYLHGRLVMIRYDDGDLRFKEDFSLAVD